MNFPTSKYSTIYADPPWEERGAGQCKRGADKHYPLMSTKDICALPVPSIAADNCHLYLWTTNNFLPDGLEVMRAWGFRYVSKIEWIKGYVKFAWDTRDPITHEFDNPGLGQYFRGISEPCLFGVKGFVPYKLIDGKRAQGDTAFFAQRNAHSQKPEEMRRMIELVSTPPLYRIIRPAQGSGLGLLGK